MLGLVEAGAAATRKLPRSACMKGFACAIAGGMIAAERFGCLDWFMTDLVGTLAGADLAFLRLSRGVQPRISAGCAEWLREIAEHPETLPVPPILGGGSPREGKGE